MEIVINIMEIVRNIFALIGLGTVGCIILCVFLVFIEELTRGKR